MLCCAEGRAGETEDSLVSIKSRLRFISTGDFLFRRQPQDYTLTKEVTTAWETLKELHSTRLAKGDLLQLVSHPDADVRALAVLALVAKETPEVVPMCMKLVDDHAPVLQRQYHPVGMTLDSDVSRVFTQPQTVADVARSVLSFFRYPIPDGKRNRTLITPEAASWWARRKDNPGWLAWHQFLYNRATQGTRPLQASDAPHVRRFMDSLTALPPTTRAWVVLYLADDVFSISGQWEDWFATETEMVAAAKVLGAEALLEFLRSGMRQGLREPALDKPENGRRFIVTYASQLFGAEHAEALLALKLYTAAADADPAQVRRVVAAGMKDLDDPTQRWGRAGVMAALATLGDGTDRERAAKWFYEEPVYEGGTTAQSVFINELKRRKPKEWREIVRRLVVDPGFDQLPPLDVMYLAMLVDNLEGLAGSVRNATEYDRKRLRAKFSVE